MDEPFDFLPIDLETIRAGIDEIKRGDLAAAHPVFAFDKLSQVWQFGDYSPDRAPHYSVAAPEWTLGMTDQFVKGIRGIDRKLQGRVLEALSHIVEGPISPRGDTVRPLSRELKELWRYRIGDYRLVYWPDVAKRQVILVAFTGRGDSYG